VLKLLVFDLDGTLADTRRDLAGAVNAALSQAGYRPLPMESVVAFVGDGARNLLSRALAAASPAQVPSAVLEAALSAFLDHYSRNCLAETRAYPGAAEALESLAGFRMAVLTNKPVEPARRILEGIGLARRFARIVGGDNPLGQKPDPAALLSIMEREGARPEETLMIGDGTQDLIAARRAGARFLGFLSGMAPREALLAEAPEAVFASMAELPAAVQALASAGRHAASGARP
jgi:phosphoglycolate phosphatase